MLLRSLYSLIRHNQSARTNALIIWSIQIAASVICGWTAFLLRFDFAIPESHWQHLLIAILVWVVCKALVLHVMRLDRGWWRYVSVHDLLRIVLGNVYGSLLSAAVLNFIAPPGFPRSIYFLDFVLRLLVAVGKRSFVRLILDAIEGKADAGRKRIFIYGAGAAGVTLLREIRSTSRLGYAACGFIDDNPDKVGAAINGMRVLGSGADLVALAAKHDISEILIALPSASGPQMAAVLDKCHAAGLKCRTIPALAEIVEEDGLARQLRDVAVDDLLGRSPVRLEQDRIAAKLESQIVLVTGAAGSIGSELCRQIARFRPAAIVGYDTAETPLFHIEREMASAFPDVPFIPIIGSVQNRYRLSDVFDRHRPSVVYHAAAYKHVPMMEAHAFEAVENNVLGTLNVARAAEEFGVDDFVMISSDKAVRPTNIMGATKRLSELVIRSLQNGSVKYVSVRFGNVLGSNGSVVPIFRQQIAAGGPVTVTHPEMRRYFMTIPEACQLVLQSSTMGHGGEIFVLDMGDPVRILDLARNLILLSGLRPDHDIKIEFTGIRPGEKLYEELNTMDEDTLPTYHEKIKIFAGSTIPREVMEERLHDLRNACATRSLDALVLTIKELVPEYNPSSDLLRRILDLKPKTTTKPRYATAATTS